MNLCEETTNLSRHLMLFLIAVFAFLSEPLVSAASSDSLLLAGLAGSLVFAVLSFLAGYSTHFQVFNDEKNNPSHGTCTPTHSAIRKLKLQYALTIISLVLVTTTLLWRLFTAHGSSSTSKGSSGEIHRAIPEGTAPPPTPE